MTKQLFISGVLILGLTTLSLAQITFQKTFGSAGGVSTVRYYAHQTTDGGYIIAGSSGGADAYLIKTDAYGDTLWTKTYGGTGYDGATFVQQTTDGGYILAGYNGSIAGGYSDAYLVKTDANGDTLWTRTFGGAISVFDVAYGVKQTSDGGYIAVASAQSFGAGDVYLIKTDVNGDTLWTKTYGGNNVDDGFSVQQTSDGGYIICGSTLSFGAGNRDIYLIRTDVNGILLWSKTFGGTSQDNGTHALQTTDGGFIIVGRTFNFTAGQYNVCLFKTDTNGDSLWTKGFGGTGLEYGYSVEQTTDGGYIVAGNYEATLNNTDFYLIKTDVNGDTLWTKSFGGPFQDNAYSVSQTADAGYIILGQTLNFGANPVDFYLIKTDSMGNSMCNEGNPPTTIFSPVLQVTNPFTSVTSPPTIVTGLPTIVGSGGTVTTLCTSVSINEIAKENSFLVSPNPSPGNITISFESINITGNVEILNIMGKNILKENIFNESKKEINLKNISEGIYFVKVFDGEKYYCKKIIIEQD